MLEEPCELLDLGEPQAPFVVARKAHEAQERPSLGGQVVLRPRELSPERHSVEVGRLQRTQCLAQPLEARTIGPWDVRRGAREVADVAADGAPSLRLGQERAQQHRRAVGVTRCAERVLEWADPVDFERAQSKQRGIDPG